MVFGLGATKAGSGWLFRYLRAHSECYLSPLKELHFFDALEKGVTESRVRRLQRHKKALAEARHAGNDKLRGKIYEIRRWWPVVQSKDPQAYVAYMTERAGKAPLVGDITPAYALLPVERLKQMAGLMDDVRFVYLMRDPVARLWSHVRMVARWNTGGDAEALKARAAHVLDAALTGQKQDVTLRGAYDAVVARLTAAVDRGKIFLGYFEDLVSGADLDRLCAFLGISPRPVRTDKKVHEGVHLLMTTDQHNRALDFLRPQYEFARSEMGRLPAAWEMSLARG